MHILITILILALSMAKISAEPAQPQVEKATWNIPFRYWSNLSPILEGTGGFNFLCEVTSLGKDVPKQDKGPFRYKTGVLKVIETLHADTKKFPVLSKVKILKVEGCEGLSIGDKVIVFVDAEPYEGGYVINRHRGTNCFIGHKLSKPSDNWHDAKMNEVLLGLVRRNLPDVSKLKADELRALSILDEQGVLEAMIRNIETTERNKKSTKGQNKSQ